MDLYAQLFFQFLLVACLLCGVWWILTQSWVVPAADPLQENLKKFNSEFDTLFAGIASEFRDGARQRQPLSRDMSDADTFSADLSEIRGGSTLAAFDDEPHSPPYPTWGRFESVTADDHLSSMSSMVDDDLHSHDYPTSNPATGLPIFDGCGLDSSGSPLGFDLHTPHDH